MPVETVLQYLYATYKFNVEQRYCRFRADNEFYRRAEIIAKVLTGSGPSFGLFLCGGTGNGKTTFCRAIAQMLTMLNVSVPIDNRYENYRLSMVQASDLANTALNQPMRLRELYDTRLLCIDDVGTEPAELINYGNAVHPVADILTHRYTTQRYTIITTNLAPHEFSARYGARIADRLREMMVIVPFDSRSYRQ